MVTDPRVVDTPILVVDLDGTLLRSDMLHESFWNALGRDPLGSIGLVAALRRGKAALKRHLAGAAVIDAATLPYDRSVVDYVADWRARGGRTVLVTATDQDLAEAIAAHLGLFDEVHGSDGARNLKGAAKADYLCERYGQGGFAYMGDAAVDLSVWARAGKAITVNAPAALRRRADALGPETEHLTTATGDWRAYLTALRPHQWLKNLLVFAPLIAAHAVTTATLVPALLAFAAFSLVASSVYVLNDLLDLSADRAHPRKRSRPFAAGTIPIAHGTVLACGLLLAGITMALPLGGLFVMVLAGYFALTTAYSLHLKHRLIVDIVALAALYTIRIIGGGVATGIPLSIWILAFSIFFFFSLAAVKRQAELVDGLENGRREIGGRDYTVADLPLISQIAIGAGYVAVLVMALYITSDDVAVLYATPAALWVILPVLLYWLTRVVMLTHRGQMNDDPVVFAARDRNSWVCILLILGLAAGATLL